MPEPLRQLLRKLMEGNSLMGTYYRRAIEDNSTIRFDKLIVKTATGSEYLTADPMESELFFELTATTGSGTNSGFYREKCYYDSFGYWHTIT